MTTEDCFTAASSGSQWYSGLERSGSCLKLYDLLHENRELIHQLGPDGITVLHKGVDHGCVKLVRFILVDMFDETGLCNCKGEENEQCVLTREGLLRKTTEYGSSAVNMAIVSGSPKMVLLLKWAIRVSSKEVNTVERTSYPVNNEQYGELLKISGCNDEASEEIEPMVDEVPDVKDDEISESIYSQETWYSEKTYDRDMQLQLYKIIAAQLNESSAGEDGVEKFLESIIAECKLWDEENKTADTMQMTLFSMLDPRGRTIMHTLFHMILTVSHVPETLEGTLEVLKGVASKSWRCYSAKDGAGRTLYHMVSIYDCRLCMGPDPYHDHMEPDQFPHVNMEVTPLCLHEFRALQMWSFDTMSVGLIEDIPQLPIYLAVLFSSEEFMPVRLQAHAKEGFEAKKYIRSTPFQLAAGLGRTKLVEHFLKVN